MAVFNENNRNGASMSRHDDNPSTHLQGFRREDSSCPSLQS